MSQPRLSVPSVANLHHFWPQLGLAVALTLVPAQPGWAAPSDPATSEPFDPGAAQQSTEASSQDAVQAQVPATQTPPPASAPAGQLAEDSLSPAVPVGAQATDELEGHGRSNSHTPRVAVVMIRRWADKNFDLSIADVLMEPLVHRVSYVPIGEVRQSIARMHISANMLHLPSSLRVLGRRLHADYVLLAEPAGNRRAPHMFVALVDVHSGETPVAKRLPIVGGRLRAIHGATVLPSLEAAMDIAEQPADEPAAAAVEAPLAEEPQTENKAGEETQTPADPEPQADDSSSLAGPDLASFDAGLAMLQRIGHLQTSVNSGVTPPQYAGSQGNSNPFFPAFSFQGKIYSGLLRKNSRRHPLDGVGLKLAVDVAPVKSYVDESAATQVSSTVTGLNLQALYRYIWMPKKALSPSTELGIGFDYFSFPLKDAQFPGVAYKSPDFGLKFDFLVHPKLALNLEAGWRPTVSPGNDAAKVLGKPSSGHGFTLGAGIGFRWKMFLAEAAFRYKTFNVGYTGSTALAETVEFNGSQAQFTNIKLTDSVKQIIIRAGVAY